MHAFGEDLSGVTLGIWGLSFKPGTDDMREASSLRLIENAIRRGARVQAYDPVAMPVARELVPAEWLVNNQLVFAEHQYDALKEVDALALVTEWKPFCYPDLTAMKNLMRQYVILDGRNQYDPHTMRDAGFVYYGIGRGSLAPSLHLIKNKQVREHVQLDEQRII
jgi:UDPglucose 6-dehydrogenase